MPFKKGITPPGAIPFEKGRSGNPKGKPKKLVKQLKEIGYTKSEVSETINVMLAMTIQQLKTIYEDNDTPILEKTIAAALKKSLEKGSLYSIDTLLNRSQGKPAETIDMTQTMIEQPLFGEQ